jgi:hypothetical protein
LTPNILKIVDSHKIDYVLLSRLIGFDLKELEY